MQSHENARELDLNTIIQFYTTLRSIAANQKHTRRAQAESAANLFDRFASKVLNHEKTIDLAKALSSQLNSMINNNIFEELDSEMLTSMKKDIENQGIKLKELIGDDGRDEFINRLGYIKDEVRNQTNYVPLTMGTGTGLFKKNKIDMQTGKIEPEKREMHLDESQLIDVPDALKRDIYAQYEKEAVEKKSMFMQKIDLYRKALNVLDMIKAKTPEDESTRRRIANQLINSYLESAILSILAFTKSPGTILSNLSSKEFNDETELVISSCKAGLQLAEEELTNPGYSDIDKLCLYRNCMDARKTLIDCFIILKKPEFVLREGDELIKFWDNNSDQFGLNDETSNDALENIQNDINGHYQLTLAELARYYLMEVRQRIRLQGEFLRSAPTLDQHTKDKLNILNKEVLLFISRARNILDLTTMVPSDIEKQIYNIYLAIKISGAQAAYAANNYYGMLVAYREIFTASCNLKQILLDDNFITNNNNAVPESGLMTLSDLNGLLMTHNIQLMSFRDELLRATQSNDYPNSLNNKLLEMAHILIEDIKMELEEEEQEASLAQSKVELSPKISAVGATTFSGTKRKESDSAQSQSDQEDKKPKTL